MYRLLMTQGCDSLPRGQSQLFYRMCLLSPKRCSSAATTDHRELPGQPEGKLQHEDIEIRTLSGDTPKAESPASAQASLLGAVYQALLLRRRELEHPSQMVASLTPNVELTGGALLRSPR